MKVNRDNSGFFADRHSNRREAQPTVMVQRTRKDGSWGQPTESRRFGNETDEQVVERLAKLNPDHDWRVAE